MILYEFKCEDCEHTFEVLTALESRHQIEPCPKCGYDSRMVISPVRSQLDGTDPAFSTAWDRWARIHEQEAKREPKDDGLSAPVTSRIGLDN